MAAFGYPSRGTATRPGCRPASGPIDGKPLRGLRETLTGALQLLNSRSRNEIIVSLRSLYDCPWRFLLLHFAGACFKAASMAAFKPSVLLSRMRFPFMKTVGVESTPISPPSRRSRFTFSAYFSESSA